MIAIDENFRISETGGTGNATIFVNATTENLFSTASTQIEVSSSVGNIKRYVTLNKKAAHGYMYTPVEWVSNENINLGTIDLGYTIKTNTRMQFKVDYVTKIGDCLIGEENTNSTNNYKWFSVGNRMYYDINAQRLEPTWSATLGEFELGNYYIKDLATGSNMASTNSWSGTRTSTLRIFSPRSQAEDKGRFYYFKIYEGDTLVMDLIPVLDKDNIPCFFDKVGEQFYYYKVNGVPSTGLTAGNIAYYTSDYIEGDGTDYVDIGYIPVANTYIEMDNQTDSMLTCGSYDDRSYGLYWECGNDTSGYWRYSNDARQILFTSLPSTRYTVKFGKQYYINGEQKGSISRSWVDRSLSVTVFGLHRPTDVTERTAGKLYGLKIFEGDTLVREYIPYKQYGVVGLYEKINGIFYPSNSNTMTQGGNIQPVVEKVIYDEEDITINNDTPSTAISAGNTFNLNASTTPTGATLNYSSSDTSIATVDSNGVVTAVGKGTATITITAQGFQDNVNKVYYNTTSKAVSVECEERNGYSYTPVEWVSNENLNSDCWIDLGYVWNNNSRAQFKGEYGTSNGNEWFGERITNWNPGGPVDDNGDLRWMYNNSNGSLMWDVPSGKRVEKTRYTPSTPFELEIGNFYIKNLQTGSNLVTGSTYNVSRTNTVGLFSASGGGGVIDKIKFYYIKIYEGDTLVKDIIPVLDSNNIPCFYDKVNGTFHYYKVDGQPSTGLTAGNALQQLEYLQGDGTDYVILDYIPSTTTRIEVDCSGRPASTPSSGAGAGTVMGCEIWNSSQPSGAQGGISIGFPGGGGVSFHYGTLSYANKTSQKIIERGVFKLDGSAAYIDDFKVADVTTSFVTQGGPFALFNSLIYNSSNGTTFPISNIYSDAYYEGKIYGVKIYENNVLVRDYVPVKSGTKKGFYDKVLGNFYPSNSNTLVTGTVVGNLTINVTYSEDDVTISNNTPSGALTVGDLFSLGASTTPTGATLSYSSSDTSIATVGISGIITAVATGTTTITITASDVFDNINKVYYKGTSKTVSVEVQEAPSTPPIYFDASNPGNANINKIASDGLSGVTKTTTAAKTVYFNVDSSATSSQSPYIIHTSDALAYFYDPDGNPITGRSVSGQEIWIPMDCNKTGTYKLQMPSSFIMSSATFKIIPPSS